MSVPPTKTGGQSWDPDAGAPDLYISNEIGAEMFSPVAVDTYAAHFDGPLKILLTDKPGAGDVAVWDDDLPDPPDGAFVCRYPTTGFDPRPRQFICDAPIGMFEAHIEPVP